MWNITKHELDMHNNSFGTYLFCSVLILCIGIGAIFYNINSAIANFEYVLGTISIVLVILIPLLTMKSFSEERKQKTDQLLYSLPLSMTEIVIGKFLALFLVFTTPMILVAIYPFIFSKFGNVYLLTSYGSLFAFLLLGAALISIGIFVSSLTEKQAVSAGISAAIIAVNYYSVKFADSLTTSGSKIMEKLSALITKLSLFDRYYSFVNGVFDITAIVYYLSVTALFLFLTIQVMEKRRYE